MNSIKKFNKVPENSLLLKGFGKTDYCDSYRIAKNTNESVDSILNRVFKIPGWVNFLMRIRNWAVGIFGLKTGDTKDEIATYYPIGSKAVYFTVTDRNENEIVMAENDKHLNFRTSLLINRKEPLSYIYLTTIVKYNNIWGRLYFMPVKPFHRIIIKTLLKKVNP